MDDESGNTITVGKDAVFGGVVIVLLGLLTVSVFTQGFGLVGAAAPPCECPEAEECEEVSQPSGNSSNTTGTADEDSLPYMKVDLGVFPLLGDDSAPVTWVEFSDYQCPFCTRLYQGAEAQVKTNYIDTGKVKLYFRDFPLSFHPQALPAAMAASCANEQGKYWEMHGKLFNEQESWSGAADVDSIFKGYAVGLGLDNASFSTCYDEAKYFEDISDDFADGQSYGVRGTPSNFLLIPKDKITEEKMTGVVDDLNTMYGDGIDLYENSDEYVVFIPGAYPYEAFDTVFTAVSY